MSRPHCRRCCPRSHPFFYFPVFYSLKGYVEGAAPADIFQRYRNELWENCKALWTIWVPAQLVNFSVVPRHMRIPFGESAATQLAAGRMRWVCCVVCSMHASHACRLKTFLSVYKPFDSC